MTITASALLAEAAGFLEPVAGDQAVSEAKILLAFALGLSRTQVSVMRDDGIDPKDASMFRALVQRRANHEPIAQIIGEREFWGRGFHVSPDVLDPRPDTETLIEVALKGPPAKRVLDLGTGSGCILLTLLSEWTGAAGTGVDISDTALAVARKNAERLQVTDRLDFEQGNWFEPVTGKYDLIVSNPPYISEDEFKILNPSVRDWEPKGALVPNQDGLGAYRQIAKVVGDYLTEDGRILLEIGWKQADEVVLLFENQGFSKITVHKDIDSRDRVLHIEV